MLLEELKQDRCDAFFFPTSLADLTGRYRELGPTAELVINAYALRNATKQEIRVLVKLPRGREERARGDEVLQTFERYAIAALGAAGELQSLANR